MKNSKLAIAVAVVSITAALLNITLNVMRLKEMRDEKKGKTSSFSGESSFTGGLSWMATGTAILAIALALGWVGIQVYKFMIVNKTVGTLDKIAAKVS